jgi:hypothetical protein
MATQSRRHLSIIGLYVLVLVLGTGIAAMSVAPEPVAAAKKCFGKKATKVTVGELDGVRTLTGTNGNDVIIGTNASEIIYGKGGKDRICAGGGDDTVLADGNWIGKGASQFYSEDDGVFGDDRDDLVYEQGGTDHVTGGAGADTCSDGEGWPDVAEFAC